MPTRELVCYVEALPAIAAARSLEASTEIAVGSGAMKQGARDNVLAAWRRELRARQAVVRPSLEELRGMAAATSIGVRTVKRKAVDASRA